MKRYLTAIGIMFHLCAFVFFVPTIAQAGDYHSYKFRPSRQNCVQCGWLGLCHACVGGGNKLSCITPDCGSCIGSGTCNGRGDIESIKHSNDPDEQTSLKDVPRNQPQKPFTLDVDLIREIAQAHPRFAATLANINAFGFYAEVYSVHWTPVEISPGDIDAFIDRSSRPGFFEEYNREARRINGLIQKGLVEEIVYDVSVEGSDDDTRVIKLSVRNDPQTIKVDPPYSSLQITLRYEAVTEGKATKVARSMWTIN